MKTITFQLQPEDNQRLNNLCGQLDEHIHQIERHLAVEISHRSHTFKIFGPDEAVMTARNFIKELYGNPKSHSSQELDIMLQAMVNQSKRNQTEEPIDEHMIIKTSKAEIKPRGANQQRYIKRVYQHDINFGIGPAGTGKTFLAVACAVSALENEKVRRIVLVRPAVEAGENLGFLPGDLSQKVDPYLRPMYDALYELMGPDKVIKLIEKNVIEIAPLAFMRGRTLNDAFIILDESQNTTKEQMKMFLTRIGFNSTAIITGDITQVDLPKGKMSGLRHVIDILSETSGISFTFFDTFDVVRHPLVQAVVEAYQKHEAVHGI
ncbi:MAG: PhoH [Gammaproteobacteria bacterium]|nr:PhoH [Gammaproteobacteria bacterium]